MSANCSIEIPAGGEAGNSPLARFAGEIRCLALLSVARGRRDRVSTDVRRHVDGDTAAGNCIVGRQERKGDITQRSGREQVELGQYFAAAVWVDPPRRFIH